MKLIRKLEFADMAPRLQILCQAIDELIENAPGGTECQSWGVAHVRNVHYRIVYYIDLNLSGKEEILGTQYTGTALSIKVSDHVNEHISIEGQISHISYGFRRSITFPDIPTILLADPLRFGHGMAHVGSILQVNLSIAGQEIERARSQHKTSIAFRWDKYYTTWPISTATSF